MIDPLVSVFASTHLHQLLIRSHELISEISVQRTYMQCLYYFVLCGCARENVSLYLSA